MRFAEPFYGILLIGALAGLGVFFYLCARLRARSYRRFADPALLTVLLSAFDARRRRLKQGMIVAAVSFGFLALMRPQWGFQWQEVKGQGLDIIIALDTSKSMLSQDILPSRLQRSKLAVADFVSTLRGDRIGLVAFSGEAFLQCPLTVDYAGFLLALDDISVETIPRGGTSLARAIQEAIRGFRAQEAPSKILVLITDGDDREGDALRAAEEAKRQGIIICCIGVGSGQGELIPLSGGEEGSFLKDRRGSVVKTRLNEELLQQLAMRTAGMYVRASGREFGLKTVYDQKLSRMQKREFEGKMHQQYHERFQLPLLCALFFLCLEPLIHERK